MRSNLKLYFKKIFKIDIDDCYNIDPLYFDTYHSTARKYLSKKPQACEDENGKLNNTLFVAIRFFLFLLVLN